MTTKSFTIGSDTFELECDYHDGRTFRLYKKIPTGFKDLNRDQKRFIVEKLKRIIIANSDIAIPADVKTYVINYAPGHKRGKKSNVLARILYDLLP